MEDTYEKAYTEVVAVLNTLSAEEYARIPKEKIDFFEKNKDKNYHFAYDETKTMDEQNISRKAKVILVSLYRDYYASDKQKVKMEAYLKQNEDIYQEELAKKYDVDEMFKKRQKYVEKEERSVEHNEIIVQKQSFFGKLINKIKNLFK